MSTGSDETNSEETGPDNAGCSLHVEQPNFARWIRLMPSTSALPYSLSASNTIYGIDESARIGAMNRSYTALGAPIRVGLSNVHENSHSALSLVKP